MKKETFCRYIRQYETDMFRFAKSIVGTQADGEDAMQERAKRNSVLFSLWWAMPESSPHAQSRRRRGPGRENLACKQQALND